MTLLQKPAETPPVQSLTRVASVLTLVIVVFAALFSWRSWHDEKANSINELNTIMELGSKAVDTYLAQLEIGLLWLGKAFTETGDRIDLDRAFVLLQRFKEMHPELVNITLFRPDGQILLTAKTPPGATQPSLAQEPSFIQYRDELQRGQAVSTGRPLTGVVSNVLIVPLRHPLRNPNGELSHILSANLAEEWLQGFWKEAPITKKAALGLMRDDGFLLSRYPVPSQLSREEIYGKPRTGTLIQHLQQHDFPASGYVEGRGSLDGLQFLTAFRRLSHFPVTLFVAMPQSEIWAAWWNKVQMPYLLTILLLMGGWMAHRVMLRRQRAWDEERETASAALRESEAWLQLALSAGHMVAWQYDPATRQVTFSKDAEKVLELPQRHETSDQGYALIHPDDVEHHRALVDGAIATGGHYASICRHVHGERVIWLEEYAQAVVDRAGQTIRLAGVTQNITERKQAEERLQESEARLQRVLEGANDGFWEWDIATGKEQYNRRWAEMLGHDLAEIELEFNSWERRVHPADLPGVWAAVQAHLAGETPQYQHEYRMQTKNGEWRWILSRGTISARDDRGRPTRMSGTHTDITDHKRMETEIQTALAFQKELLDAIPAPVFYKDVEGRYQRVNRAFTEFFNRPASELVGKTVHECWPETASLLSAKDQELFQNPGVQVYETQIENGRGERCDVVYHKATFHHPDGSLRGMIGVMLDITAQKAAEQSLRESEARLQRVLDGTNDGFWDWNVVTEKVWFSRRWAEMLGYDLADIEPHVCSWEQLVHPADMPGIQTVLQAHLDGVTSHYECEHRLRAKNGEWRWVLDRGKVAARDDRGQPLRMSGTHTDVTDRKAAELALRAAQRELLAQQDHLEELVAQRTAELATALDAAEAAGRAKSAFLANMSHEIRTPLNAILGFTHLLRRGASDPGQSDKLSKITGAANQLLALLNDVLDFAKLDADRLVLEHVEFAPATVLHEAHARWVAQAQAKHLDLRVELDPDLARYPALYGDPTRLAQLLGHYLDNAIKFTERGAVTLRGCVLDERVGGVLLRFEVQDEGPGIAPEALPGLFATFEQADGSTTRRHGGTGLGLALNRRLARLMGGEVGVESQPGAGSTFWCTVRLDKSAAAEIAAPAAPAAPAEVLSPPPADVAPVVDGERVRAVLAELDALLADDDVQASAVFREAAPLLRAALGEVAATVERQIGQFDYPQARQTLRAAWAEALDETKPPGAA